MNIDHFKPLTVSTIYSASTRTPDGTPHISGEVFECVPFRKLTFTFNVNCWTSCARSTVEATKSVVDFVLSAAIEMLRQYDRAGCLPL